MKKSFKFASQELIRRNRRVLTKLKPGDYIQCHAFGNLLLGKLLCPKEDSKASWNDRGRRMSKQYKPLKVGHYYKEGVIRFFTSVPQGINFRFVKVIARKKVKGSSEGCQYAYMLKCAYSSHYCIAPRCPFKQTKDYCNENAITCYQLSNAKAASAFIPVSILEGMMEVGE